MLEYSISVFPTSRDEILKDSQNISRDKIKDHSKLLYLGPEYSFFKTNGWKRAQSAFHSFYLDHLKKLGVKYPLKFIRETGISLIKLIKLI